MFWNRFNADRYLAKNIPGIDMIVGGHSHAFLWDWKWGPPPAITHKCMFMVFDDGHVTAVCSVLFS